jgi:hypothetical protein
LIEDIAAAMAACIAHSNMNAFLNHGDLSSSINERTQRMVENTSLAMVAGLKFKV